MWSNRNALASRTSVKASARLCRKLQRCQIPRFSLATKVMHIINPYRCNVVHLYIDEASKNLHHYVSVLLVIASSYHLIYCPDATTNSGYLLRNAISVLNDIVVRHLPTAYPPYYTLTDCIPEQLPTSCSTSS